MVIAATTVGLAVGRISVDSINEVNRLIPVGFLVSTLGDFVAASELLPDELTVGWLRAEELMLTVL